MIVEKAISVLEKGGIIVYPSDTVYGIAVDGTNPGALRRLDKLKHRRSDQKYSYNFASIEMVKKFFQLSEDQEKTLEKYLPGPFTFIISPEISVRIPKDSIITEITSAYGKPTTATSANITGKPPSGSIKTLDAKIYLAADLIIEDPDLEPKKPSTVVDISKVPYKILREGELPFEG